MAAEVQRLWFAASARPRVEAVDRELARACEELLAGGPVSFDLSTRANLPLLPRPKRLMVAVMRSVPEPFYVPPDLNVKECVFDGWGAAVDACESPDDQILVRPRNRFFRRGEVSPAICCRPKDPADALRFNTLCSVFAVFTPRVDPISLVETKLSELERRLTALERAKGTRCASGSAS